MTFRHFGWAKMANRQNALPNNVIKQMKARAAWKQKKFEPVGHYVASEQKKSLRPRNDEKHTC